MAKITNISGNVAEILNDEYDMTKAGCLNRLKVMFSRTSGNKEEKKNAMNVVQNALEIGTSVFALVSLDDIEVDMTYQRNHGNRAQKIASVWDDKKCSPLIINIRENGKMEVIDGWTHACAAKIAGKEYIAARIFVGLTVAEEAEIFASQGEGIKKPDPYDILKANLVCGEVVDTEIKRICDEFGVVLKPSTAIHSSSKVATCLTFLRGAVGKKNGKGRCINTKGRDAIEKTFKLIQESGLEDYDKSHCYALVSSIYSLLMDDAYEKYNPYEIIKANLTDVSPSLFLSYANVKYPMQSEGSGARSLITDFVVGNDSMDALRGRVKKMF